MSTRVGGPQQGGPISSRPTRARWDQAREALRTQLWPLPVAGVVGAVTLGVGLPRLDARVDDGLSASVSSYLFGGGADAARDLLSAVAGSLITVTSLTFSLTVVTLQLASSQFSPRLLRTFTRDRVVHVTLAVFLATFTYALTVLRTVRTSGDGRAVFVPQLAVTTAFLLALVSVLALVLFLAHLAAEIRVETALRNVHAEATQTVCRVLDERDPDATPAAPPDVPAGAALLCATSSGFLVRVDERALLAAAVETDAVLLLSVCPGSSVVDGTPVGALWPVAAGSEVGTGLAGRAAAAIVTGYERTAGQDVAYGLRQLVDVAVKALSPGINDPTTAVHALGHCAALLCELARRDLGPRLLTDGDGRVRVVLRRPTLADLLELAVAQPRRYGAADALVLGRLADLLREVAWSVPPGPDRRLVADQLDRLRATMGTQDFDAHEQAGLERATAAVEAALAGHRSLPPA